ncbi:tyrosine-type recombinase/integrase [Kribbella pratensis]|uniref:tyrosine-type recombinase/integrase n=1 Tax=Kribbella pratensis TaxID=2512112 RepID=UPI00192DAF07|nr:tyrosine-type recombinase/integrase [Kribbella pratensis]
MSFQSVRETITRQCEQIAATNPAFTGLRFTPHDFRRLFAPELVNNGLPIRIGAKLLGHLDLATTQGYVAVFEEDTVRHYQHFLARRRALRPDDEYGPVNADEWSKFEERFDKRKVELGDCDRPYGSPCQHEHACIRCPMLRINPAMLPRLTELETDSRHAETERQPRAGSERSKASTSPCGSSARSKPPPNASPRTAPQTVWSTSACQASRRGLRNDDCFRRGGLELRRE